jgi:hypothetical protein
MLSEKFECLSEAMMKHIIKVVASVMQSVKNKLNCQYEDIAHPNNIFIDKSRSWTNVGDIKLADYGMNDYFMGEHKLRPQYINLRRFYYPP